MKRGPLYLFAALSLALAVLCGCQAAGSLFNPDAEGRTTAGAIAQDAANATGNPLIIGIVGAVNAAVAGVLAVMARKGAKKDIEANDAKEWTAEEVQSIAAALRSHGFKVERA